VKLRIPRAGSAKVGGHAQDFGVFRRGLMMH
jgi:hypothetical protein